MEEIPLILRTERVTEGRRMLSVPTAVPLSDCSLQRCLSAIINILLCCEKVFAPFLISSIVVYLLNRMVADLQTKGHIRQRN